MMNYKILGKIDVKFIRYSGPVEVLCTILLCYTLAVTLHHKPAWLPTISECGQFPPEKYFFRWGILVGGMLLVIEVVFLHNARKVSDLCYVFGLVAGLCLTGVASVACNENLTIHLAFALSFFLLEDLMVLLMLFEHRHSLTIKSLLIKLLCVGLAFAATILHFLLVLGVIKYASEMPIVAMIEWTNVGALLMYHVTLSGDLDDLYAAELKVATNKEQVPEVKIETETKTPL